MFRDLARRTGSPRTGRSDGAARLLGQNTVYLVDKPGAAQSVIAIGQPGVERRSPDYFALQVMNTILGGSFSSRLNQNLRETKGVYLRRILRVRLPSAFPVHSPRRPRSEAK